jgi:hypothetical protein
MNFRPTSVVFVSIAVILTCSCHKDTSTQPQETPAQTSVAAAGQVLTASQDANGNQHPASAGITRPSTVTCISAVGNPGYPASCSINNQIVNVNNSVGASNTVYLTCNGQGALRCSARIN